MIKKSLITLTVVLLAVYLADELLFLHKLHTTAAYCMVDILTYTTVPEKNNRIEFFAGDPEIVPCVHALFPHAGDAPCWYISQHKEKRTDL